MHITLPFSPSIHTHATDPLIDDDNVIKDSRTFNDVNNFSNDRKMPLFLEDDDNNFKKFVNGMAMLNYNLAYLCYTQNIKIPVSQTANTLQSLMACCRASDLGM